jgi:hypothetical protein
LAAAAENSSQADSGQGKASSNEEQTEYTAESGSANPIESITAGLGSREYGGSSSSIQVSRRKVLMLPTDALQRVECPVPRKGENFASHDD